MKITKIILMLLFLMTAFSCVRNSRHDEERIIIGISSDVESLSPLYSFTVAQGYLSELMFLSLVRYKWDNENHKISVAPMLAEEMRWNQDSTSIEIALREDVQWSDGSKLTANDISFSLWAYSNPEVNSRFVGVLNKYYLLDDGTIDTSKSITILSDYKFRLNFHKDSNPAYFEFDFPIIPAHRFINVNPKDFEKTDFNFQPVTSGPYKLKRWERNQHIILEKTKTSFLNSDETVGELVFKIVPDYVSRITQLKTGELDLVEEVKPEDTRDLKAYDHLKIATVGDREYDYIGWNNILRNSRKNKSVNPHQLFGTPEVRTALAMTVNKEEFISEYLNGFGKICKGPISDIFIDNPDRNPVPLGFDLKKAAEVLSSAGWKDTNGDGLLDKDGVDFSFELIISSGNPRKDYLSEVLRNNLRSIGIKTKIKKLEMGLFIEKLLTGDFDAFIAGAYVPIPLEMRTYWYSDLDIATFNLICYRNPAADKIINELENSSDYLKNQKNIIDLQRIIYRDQPVSFLYWIDNIIVHNSRLENASFDPLSAIHDCWNWRISGSQDE